jgi:hypothetical protein
MGLTKIILILIIVKTRFFLNIFGLFTAEVDVLSAEVLSWQKGFSELIIGDVSDDPLTVLL